MAGGASDGWRQKRYGRIAGTEIEQWLAVLNEVWAERQSWKEFAEDEAKASSFLGKLVEVPNWVNFYSDTLVELLAKVFVVAGLGDKVSEAIKSEDSTGNILGLVNELSDEAPVHPAALPLAFAMIGNLDAIATYSRSINDMLSAGKAGDIEALFQALSVDSYISTLPFFQSLLRLGQLSDDHEAAEAIFRAIKGPHRRRLDYIQLRWVEYLLRDQGAFEACSREEIYELVVEGLGLYDQSGVKEDPKAALFKLFRTWQKQAGIQNPKFGFSAK